jgi:HSP20 family protein
MALELMRRPLAGTELGRGFVPLRTLMDRLLETAFTPSFWFDWRGGPAAGCPMDVYEDNERYIVHCLLPGVDPNAVNVSVQDNILIISGEWKSPAPEGARPVFQEIGQGQFRRQVTLDYAVEPGQAEASYQDGILTITLPKAESAKAKAIKVHTGGRAEHAKQAA